MEEVLELTKDYWDEENTKNSHFGKVFLNEFAYLIFKKHIV